MSRNSSRAPHSRDEIVAELEHTHHDGTRYWDGFATGDFFSPLGTAWSPGDTVRHLLKSTRPVAKALSLPRLMLWISFGRSRRPSISFDELRAKYTAALAAGGQAGRFAPAARSQTDLEAWRASIMRQRERVHADLEAAIRRWPDAALDRYRLPHPLIGKLTLREMLFFTLYHHMHHVQVVERRRNLNSPMSTVNAQLTDSTARRNVEP